MTTISDRDHVGDIAIVLHSHMPYVEGFGTYPFGEEWLFDAAVRSYLAVLAVAQGLTMTITPVLADPLEDPPGERLAGGLPVAGFEGLGQALEILRRQIQAAA